MYYSGSTPVTPWTFVTDYGGDVVTWDDLFAARWVDQITWAMRLLNVQEPGLTGVADHGASPVSLLGSSLTMPIEQGWSERMANGFICLDCSLQRLQVVPGFLASMPVTTLVVRGEALLPLDDLCRREGVMLEKLDARVIVTLDRLPAANMVNPAYDYLVMHEASLVIAPLCRDCGHFHLRRNWYSAEAEGIRNMKAQDLPLWSALSEANVVQAQCARGPGDLLLDMPGMGAAHAA